MEEKVDIVALGELLIDFTEAGHSQDGRKLFEQNPGGAPANLLTVAPVCRRNFRNISPVARLVPGNNTR